jgi:hypothetical protein
MRACGAVAREGLRGTARDCAGLHGTARDCAGRGFRPARAQPAAGSWRASIGANFRASAQAPA